MNREHQLAKLSFEESKDIINNIFTLMDAPEDWFIKHMTFDELVAALYKILYLCEELKAEISSDEQDNE